MLLETHDPHGIRERGTGSIGPAEVRDVIQGGWNEYSWRKSVCCEPYRCAEANWSNNSSTKFYLIFANRSFSIFLVNVCIKNNKLKTVSRNIICNEQLLWNFIIFKTISRKNFWTKSNFNISTIIRTHFKASIIIRLLKQVNPARSISTF